MIRQFSWGGNLDDESECETFLKEFGQSPARRITKALAFVGAGSVAAAQALKNYAWNKKAAVSCRHFGKINEAMIYEATCNRIYREDIQPVIECW